MGKVQDPGTLMLLIHKYLLSIFADFYGTYYAPAYEELSSQNDN